MSSRPSAIRCLAGVSAFALLSMGGGARAFAEDQAPPQEPVKWSVFVQGGYAVDTGNANPLPYAQFYGPDQHVVPQTTIFPFNVGSGGGFDVKAGVTAHLDNRWSANLVYTGLRTSKTGDSGLFSNYGVVSVLPNGYRAGRTGIGSSWDEAKVKTDVAADVVDFQAGYDVGLGHGASGTVLAGIRYGDFSQDTSVDILNHSGSVEFRNHRRSSFWGVGPSLGLKAAAPIGVQGFGISGSVVGGVLFGNLTSNTTGANSGGTPVIPRHFGSNSTVAGTVNSDLALTYTKPMGRGRSMTVAAGYQVSYYADVRDTRNGSSGNGAAIYGSTSASLLDHGPFLRLGFGF